MEIKEIIMPVVFVLILFQDQEKPGGIHVGIVDQKLLRKKDNHLLILNTSEVKEQKDIFLIHGVNSHVQITTIVVGKDLLKEIISGSKLLIPEGETPRVVTGTGGTMETRQFTRTEINKKFNEVFKKQRKLSGNSNFFIHGFDKHRVQTIAEAILTEFDIIFVVEEDKDEKLD
jgi:hypothetical protein